MSEHLPEELHYLLKHEKLRVCVNGTSLDVVLREDKNYGCVTIGIGSNESVIDPDSKYHSDWIYISFKDRLWYQSTVFDSEGRDYIDGGEWNNRTNEENQEMTRDIVRTLLEQLVVSEI